MLKQTLFFLLAFCAFGASAQGHKIDLQLKGMRDSVIILGYYNGDKLNVQDSLKLDKQGRTTIQGKEKLPRGKYFLYLDEYKRFDLLIGNEQSFSLVADTTDLVNKVSVTGSKENQLFYGYIAYIQDKITKRSELSEKLKAETNPEAKKALQNEMQTLMGSVKGHMDNLIKQNPTTFFAHQLKAGFQVEIPAEVRKQDRKKQFEYYKKHYFDNVDFSESGLARTKEFPNMLDVYLEKMIYQVPDSIFPEIDMLVKKARSNQDMFKFMVMHLHDYYVTSENVEMENVYTWYFDKYFQPEARWIDKEFMNKRAEYVKKVKPLLIGKKAPNITMELFDVGLHDIFSKLIRLSRENDDINKKKEKGEGAKLLARQQEITDSLVSLNAFVKKSNKRKLIDLHSVKAKYTILAFWEPECSHCKKAIPELHEKYVKELKAKNIEVYAACTQLKPNVWGEFLDKHKMKAWTNVWDPYNNSDFREKYDIHSTPAIFILSRDKKILLKKVAVEHLDEAIKYLDNRYK